MHLIDKTVFGRHPLADSDKMDRRTRDYWMAQSAEDRFLGMELLRRMRHGAEYETFRMDLSVFGKHPLREESVPADAESSTPQAPQSNLNGE